MEKENIVLLHSFPTNSILLSGLIEYLSDYFNVYFVDLPGFTKKVPPLKKITFAGYSEFVENKIKEFNLDHYLLGGISFGFAIVNNLDHDDKCKGLLAIEPFIGARSLRMSPKSMSINAFFIQIVCSLKLYSLFWGSKLAKRYLPKLRHYPQGTMNVMFEQIDGRTFFETANVILHDKSDYKFSYLPYALVANPNDRTVNYDFIHKTLSEHAKNLLVINIAVDHYPKDTSKEYFRKMIPEEIFQKIAAFFSDPDSIVLPSQSSSQK